MAPARQVHKYVRQRYQIIPPTLLERALGLRAAVSHRPGRIRLPLQLQVLVGLRTDIPFHEAEVNQVERLELLARPDQEVLGLEVSVDVSAQIYTLSPLNHLVSNKMKSCSCKIIVAKLKQIIDRWPENVHHHGIVLAFDADPVDITKAIQTSQFLVDLGLVEQLLLQLVLMLQLNRNLFIGPYVLPLIKYPERTIAKLGTYLILIRNHDLDLLIAKALRLELLQRLIELDLRRLRLRTLPLVALLLPVAHHCLRALHAHLDAF